MKPFRVIGLLSILFFFQTDLRAQMAGEYTAGKKIPLPGDGGYDYLYLDNQDRRLYVSHGNQVQVLDLNSEELIGTIGEMQGVHGIAIAHDVKKGFISDGDANAVIVFDPATFKMITRIPLTGKDPDAIIYDPFSQRVFAFNGHSSNMSVIDVNTLKEIQLVPLGGGPEFAVPMERVKYITTWRIRTACW